MIDNGLMSLVLADRKLSDGELQRIRENGEGDGFKVLDPRDGFRQDGSLWFGTCSACHERVTNSQRDGMWEHSTTVTESYHTDGSPLSQSTQFFDYCPTARRAE